MGLTGFVRLDPLIALAVAVNILFTGDRLLARSARGLMNVALPAEETAEVKSILDSYRTGGISYHSLRSRQAAARKFLVVHVLVPGDWTVCKGHQVAEEIEQRVIAAIPHSSIVTHIEPIENPISQEDINLDRG